MSTIAAGITSGTAELEGATELLDFLVGATIIGEATKTNILK